MSLAIFNPNHISQAQTPEGHAGPNAGFLLPFYSYGHYYTSGLQQVYLGSEIVQKRSTPVFGRTRPNTFRKDASSCPTADAVV